MPPPLPPPPPPPPNMKKGKPNTLHGGGAKRGFRRGFEEVFGIVSYISSIALPPCSHYQLPAHYQLPLGTQIPLGKHLLKVILHLLVKHPFVVLIVLQLIVFVCMHTRAMQKEAGGAQYLLDIRSYLQLHNGIGIWGDRRGGGSREGRRRCCDTTASHPCIPGCVSRTYAALIL